MTSRLRSASILVGALVIAGCGDASAPLRYARNDRFAEQQAIAAGGKVKPSLRDKVYESVDKLFGDSPRDLKVPAGSGLPGGGIRLANHVLDAKDGRARVAKFVDSSGKVVYREGGYALYRRHCQHCHGSSGDGNGPTADFLYPRPRDYRRGLYKFTSTVSNQKPTRADLRKTIYEGIHGTSMPAFEALMTPNQIEQVIDYVIFLSMRGEVECRLLTEIATADEWDPDIVQGSLEFVFNSWKDADKNVVDPPVSRARSDHASVVRGRDLFWKNDCLGCHGPKAMGDGLSFIDEQVFQEAVFRNPSKLERLDDAEVLGQILDREKKRKEGGTAEPLPERIRSVASPASGPNYTVPVAEVLARLEANGEIRRESGTSPGGAYAVTIKPELVEKLRKEREAWLGSLDDWGNPLRPANLQKGVYKGGRRPLDLYWRIAKGINGAKMPAHDQSLKPEQIWDLVNFVLTLPYEPVLVQGTPPPAEAPKVAER